MLIYLLVTQNLKDEQVLILEIAASSWYLNLISTRRYRFVDNCEVFVSIIDLQSSRHVGYECVQPFSFSS